MNIIAKKTHVNPMELNHLQATKKSQPIKCLNKVKPQGGFEG